MVFFMLVIISDEFVRVVRVLFDFHGAAAAAAVGGELEPSWVYTPFV